METQVLALFSAKSNGRGLGTFRLGVRVVTKLFLDQSQYFRKLWVNSKVTIKAGTSQCTEKLKEVVRSHN